jgi:hypothetical protein
MSKSIFTEEEKKELYRMMNDTWQYIGYDAITMNEGKDLPRSHVIEFVIDADRLRDHAKTEKEKEIVSRFYSLKDYKAMCRIAKNAFPFSKYGM